MGIYHIDTDLAYEVLNISDQGFVFQVLSYTRRHNETYTSQISNRFQTSLYFREMELFKYLNLDQRLKAEYRKVRHRYALFIFKQRLKGDKKCLDWHRKYLAPIKVYQVVRTGYCNDPESVVQGHLPKGVDTFNSNLPV